jgi:cytidyltransferase-like protein
MKVWVNGSFDVMHIGHIKLLEFASNYGSVRVGLDTDERIKSKKGETRPFNTLEDRMFFMSSIKYVDSVCSFGSDEELENRIKEYDADIIIIGDDYKYKPIIGVEYVERVLFFPKVLDKSTTLILNDKNFSNR